MISDHVLPSALLNPWNGFLSQNRVLSSQFNSIDVQTPTPPALIADLSLAWSPIFPCFFACLHVRSTRPFYLIPSHYALQLLSILGPIEDSKLLTPDKLTDKYVTS